MNNLSFHFSWQELSVDNKKCKAKQWDSLIEVSQNTLKLTLLPITVTDMSAGSCGAEMYLKVSFLPVCHVQAYNS